MMKFHFDKDDALDWFGVVAAAFVTAKVGLLAWCFLRRNVLCRPLDVGKMFGGRWAVVTGATDGIGKAYASALAGRGMNVVLVSRSQPKLDRVAEEICSAAQGVETRTVAVDFVNDDAHGYRLKVARGIEGLEVAVLVNNVGMSYDIPARFLEIDDGDSAERIVRCNVASLNNMTSLVLPQMVDRKSGIVINVSSFAGTLPTPMLTVYSATKAYVDFFSRGLQAEYAADGIVVQTVVPFYVVSKISKIRTPTLMAPTPDAFVRSALARLGVEARTTGYWAHDLQSYFCLHLLPECLALRLIRTNLTAVRQRGLNKLKQPKSQ